MITETQELLADFVKNESEPAFRELVTRYFDLVYSTAVRLLDGDTHRAKDVSQMVFADLAKMAGKLSASSMLGGWLHRHTCFVARTVMRGERRRQARERQAAEMNALNDKKDSVLALIAPILDEAIQELGPDDRDAILLRFFEQRNLRAVGDALGTNENVAQKRVSRAVEALGALLQRRGIALSVGGLAGALATGAVTAAPMGMALSIAGTVWAGTGASGIAVTSVKVAISAKLKIAIVGAILVLGIVTVIFLQMQPRRLTQATRALVQPLSVQQEENLPGSDLGNQQIAASISGTDVNKSQAQNAESASKGTTDGPKEPALEPPPQSRKVAPVPPTRFYSRAGSKIRISGTSNVQDWQAESHVLGGFFEVGPGFPMEPGPARSAGPLQAKGEVHIMIRSLQSVDKNGTHFSDTLDQVIYDSLRAEQEPRILFRLLEIYSKGNSSYTDQCDCRGELAIAGITNEVSLPIFLEPLGDGKFKISGRTSIKLTSFQIEPRAPKLGTMLIRAGDDVKVQFDWLVAAKGGAMKQIRSGMVPLILDLPDFSFKNVPREVQHRRDVEPVSDKPRPPMMVPPGLKNIAPGSKMTSSDKGATANDLAKITDGDKEGSEQSILFLRKGTQWVQMDLGKPQEIFAIVLWHAHNTAKIYHDVIVQVADDPDFTKNVHPLFNNFSDKSSDLSAGKDKEYIETYEGKLIDAKGIVSRYIRFYSKGSSESALNEYTEIEVYGRPAQ